MPEPKGKINLYGLGSGGVNVVKSPLHLDDNELTKAQNAVPDRSAGHGGIRKRDGLVAHTTGVLAGALTGLMGIPLALPAARILHIGGFNVVLPAFGTETVNTVLPQEQLWTDFTSGVFAGGFQTQNGLIPLIQPAISHEGIFYFASNSERGTLIGYDGTQYYTVAKLPASGALGPIFLHQGLLYVGSRGSGGFANYVYQIDQATGTARIIAQSTVFTAATEFHASGTSYMGKLWVGTSKASAGVLYSIRPNDTAWVVERTLGAGRHTYTSLAMYKGKLYAATAADAATAAIIEERTIAGVWSTTRTGGASAEPNYFDGLQVYNGYLYAIYTSASQFNGGTGDDTYTSEVHKFDGTTWSVDRDLVANGGLVVPLGKTVTSGNLYYSFRRNPGGASPYTSDSLLQLTTAGAYSTKTMATGDTMTLGFTGELT